MINARMLGMLFAAFVAGSFVASPELRAYAANTVFSTDIVDGQVKTVDLAVGAVTAPKLGANSVNSAKVADGTIATSDLAAGAVSNSDISNNAVTSNKIADGTIVYADLSRNLIAVEHRNDCNCGGTGWDPDGTQNWETIYDDRIRRFGVVAIMGSDGIPNITCWAEHPGPSLQEANVLVRCSGNIPQGYGINYAIFNNPAYG